MAPDWAEFDLGFDGGMHSCSRETLSHLSCEAIAVPAAGPARIRSDAPFTQACRAAGPPQPCVGQRHRNLRIPVGPAFAMAMLVACGWGFAVTGTADEPKENPPANAPAENSDSLPIASTSAPPVAISGEDAAFFEAKIRPVLVEHCYSCHAADAKIVRGGLLVDSRDAIRGGGDSGPGIVPGDTEQSLILAALRHEAFEMPPDKKLPDAVIADFEAWIERGAPDPRDRGNAVAPRGVDWPAARSHWAFTPISDPSPPLVDDDGWVTNAIDRFILQRLQSEGMEPAPRADKRALIRRATFDLTGLPPTVEEVQAFLADESPRSFATVIDRLLDSPQYGERWGRHWLDLVRYADSNGADENHDLPQAWRYRDWVVRMINRDLPFDQFITQQLAGDLLPVPADEQAAGDLLTATGMLVIGPKMLAEQDKDKMIIDIVDEQVDTVSRTLLGLTVACARCHDHKFDPISAEDYYALAGIFYSTKTMADRAFVSNWMERPLPSAEITARRQEHQPKIDAAQAELAAAEAALKAGEEQLQKAAADAKQAAEAAAQAAAATEAPADKTTATAPTADPPAAAIATPQAPAEPATPEPPKVDIEALKATVARNKETLEKLTKEMPAFTLVMAVDEGPPKDLPVHIRGNHLALGDRPIPRNMPSLLTEVAPAPALPSAGSGRLELARWLTSIDHPLTARVMVNRVWMWHFGEAIVRSPSNFGLQAQPPTHPELLDWLARQWVREGWSLKQLHRLILLSSTYQMASDPAPEHAAEYAQRDPDNRFWHRQNRRRLEAEPIRDAVLAVGGGLDQTFGGRAPNTGDRRRAIYLPINRAALYEMFSTFDYVETANHIEQRPTTTVPHQALFLLNSPIVHEQAERIARGLTEREQMSPARIDSLFWLLYGRGAAEAEIERALLFLAAAEQGLQQVENATERTVQTWAALCRAMIAANEFVYVD